MRRRNLLPLLLVALALSFACRKGPPSEGEGSPDNAPEAPAPGRAGPAGDEAAAAEDATGGDAGAATTGATDATAQDGGSKPTEMLEVTFFPEAQARSFVGSFLLPDSRPVEGVWTPTREDLDRLLAGLPARLEADRDRRGREVAENMRARLAGENPDAPWDRYGVQVVGVTSAGRRLVYANFYCNPSQFEDWKEKSLVMVLDGGTCYFQVWFDPETGEYPRVVINGQG